MKIFFLNIVILFAGINSYSQIEDLKNEYFNAAFSGNYPKAKYILLKMKKRYPENLKTKLIAADYFRIMFETVADNEKYFVLSKKYADEAAEEINEKKTKNADDVFGIISAKSIVLKMDMKRKNYLKAAKNMQSIIKYFEYAAKNETESDKMKFISGMYNYYVETAKEDYPVIYPVLLFYPSGDKRKGLGLLKECTKSSDVNIRTRSFLQLALIYYRDEKNKEKTEFYFDKLLAEYPDNILWQIEYYKALKKFDLYGKAEIQKELTAKKISESRFLTDEQKVCLSGLVEAEE